VVEKRVSDSYWRTAASKVVMWSGRHFAQFTVLEGQIMFFGAIRPAWDVERGANCQQDGCCLYYTFRGTRLPDRVDWRGMQDAKEQGDRIGMLLDLDQGSMTVWKNDVQLGVMQSEGLSGPLCWAVSQSVRTSARIESAALPGHQPLLPSPLLQ